MDGAGYCRGVMRYEELADQGGAPEYGDRLGRAPCAEAQQVCCGDAGQPTAPESVSVTILPGPPKAERATAQLRPSVRGKFIFVGEEKFYVRGVTYGTFRPDENGDEFPAPRMMERDFALMAENGINAVRTYTAPPRWLLDAAQRHGLRVMVGLPVEREAAFLDYEECAQSTEQMVREKIRACAGHPAVLCYTIGNEIPASIVRWQGRRKLERFLERLYKAAKKEDPDGLVTYVNYPSTEYLRLPFLDFVCFNVYLESQDRLEAYLARLHNIASERPLVMGELGLDSLRHGEDKQAQVLDWQVRTAFAEVPFRDNLRWPRVSVIVCTHNGARTIVDSLEALQKLEYPDYEVIVVD